ncbi:MAG: inositol-3-phosphate synthase [Candidatus Helarchaeales archaeon]
MQPIKIAVAGVGNCCAALVQGIHYYRNNGASTLGLIHETFGGYLPSDVEIVAAFDVTENKVGKDLGKAIFERPNNVMKIHEVPELGVPVQKGELLDGFSEMAKQYMKVSKESPVVVHEILRKTGAEILINLVPSGAIEATEYYASEALKARCAFINATPHEIASDRMWAKKFRDTGIPVVGDDIMNQIGSTIIHKSLLKMLTDRGIIIKESYCLDVGGAMESLNSLERSRVIKRRFKSEAVKSQIPELHDVPIVSGSTDYVDFLENKRDSYFWILGHYFKDAPVKIDLQLSTVDAPNAFAILLDAIRGVKIALDRKLSGAIESVSAFCFKRPPKEVTIQEAQVMIDEFISGRRDR